MKTVPVDYDPFENRALNVARRIKRADGGEVSDELVAPPSTAMVSGDTLHGFAKSMVPEYLQNRPMENMPSDPGKMRAVDTPWQDAVGFGAIDAASMLPAAGVKAGMAAMGVMPVVRRLVTGAEPEAAAGIRAFHGSPHVVDPRFDMSKVGTGEGAQTYGHGLYFAENEATARSYRDTLSPKVWPDGRTGRDLNDPAHIASNALLEHRGDVSAAIDGVKAIKNLYGDAGSKALDLLQSGKAQMPKINGHMYEVNINADPAKFLDWDNPLAAQSNEVRNLIEDVSRKSTKATPFFLRSGDTFADPNNTMDILKRLSADPKWKDKWDEDRAWYHINQRFPNYTDASKQQIADSIQARTASPSGVFVPPSATGADIHSLVNNVTPGTPADTSRRLLEAGVPGIKYFDQWSRGAGEGSRNYVVFDDKIIDILRKYGIAGLTALPPAVAAGVRERLVPVDHDPFKDES